MSAARHRATLAAASFAVVVGLGVVAAADGGKSENRGDRVAPSAPANIRVNSATQTTVSLAWDRSTDNRRVAGYDVIVRGHRHRVSRPAYTARGLVCGETVDVWIAALDRRGNRSRKVGATVSTAPCIDVHAPTPPSGFRQVATTQNSVVLAWSSSSDDVGVVGYRVYQNALEVEWTTQPTATLAGLRCDTTYGYAVDAVDSAGNNSVRTPVWVRTARCPDNEAPSTPTGIMVTARTTTSVSLKWSAATDNLVVTGYDVSVGGTHVATVSQTSAKLSGLMCGTTHAIEVSALDDAGNRSPSASTTAATAACPELPPKPPVPPSNPQPPFADTTPPSVPTGLAVTGATVSSISLSWAAATDDVGVVGFTVFRDGSSVQTTSQRVATVSGLVCGKAYTLAVEARDGAGNRSGQASVVASTSPCADTLLPTAPSAPWATTRTQTSITLLWSVASDNVGVAGYGLYRGGALVGTSAETTGVFTGLTCEKSYTLAVDAFDAAGNRSAKSPAILVSTTTCSDTTPPTPPTGVSVSAVSQAALTLSWNASTDNVGVTGYDVYRAGTKVASTASLTVAQTGLTCGTSYAFGVRARDAAGNSSSQASLTAMTSTCSPVPAPPGPGSPSVRDPAQFPKMASHLSHTWDAAALSRFSLNVVRGCAAAGAVRDSFALNPAQVNLIVPGYTRPDSQCGNEQAFAVTYGSGYWSHTSAFSSPYPGIGTIRAITGDDTAKAPDGSAFIMSGYGHPNIDMARHESAEWAARLKSHYALANVNGSFGSMPWIHGVWGDNDTYWNSQWSQRVRGPGPAWDDGLVKNHRMLRTLLGDGVVVGGNGAAYTCSGLHGDAYVGTIADGDCTSTDAAMYEEGSNKFFWIEAWDDNVPAMHRWMERGLPGRARYGIMAVYGSEVEQLLGRPLTSADKRLALAMANIGGWHLWITQGSGWETTIVPGMTNSIPEMGGTSEKPYGWLGQPTESPVRIASGLWRRSFTGGAIYANVTTGTATIDGKSVPAKDALFVRS